MRRFCCLVLLVLMAGASALAGDKNKPKTKEEVFPQAIVHARYVYVTTFTGTSEASLKTAPEDRETILEVQEALKRWGRYAVTYYPDNAELIIAVRSGRLASVQPSIVLGRGRRETNGQSRTVGTGLGLASEVGSPDDTLAVFNPVAGGNNSAPLWRRTQRDGLGRGLPLLREFREQVETAAARKP